MFLGILDIEATYLVVKAHQYTTFISIQVSHLLFALLAFICGNFLVCNLCSFASRLGISDDYGEDWSKVASFVNDKRV